jgi:N-acetylneuraminic acid mutarotase
MRNYLLPAILLFFCFAACRKSAVPPRPAITGFSPSKGAAGIEVAIYGHFDSTLQQLGVYFNGDQAKVFSTSDSEIVVIVPSGVTTGKIMVTVNNLPSTTDSDFVVLPGTWTQMAHIPLDPNASVQRWLGIGFAIGSYGYMGFGTDNGRDYSDMYQFDPVSNSWTQKTSLGLGMENLVSMVIGSKAYIGIGESRDLGANTNQFYEYDPSTDTWTRKSDFPGQTRQGAFAFGIGGLGYVGLGYGASSPSNPNQNLYDVWQYDPSLDLWTQKANFPTGGEFPNYGTAFSPDNQVGYLVGSGDFLTGEINLGVEVVWRYDPASDSWTQMHNLPTTSFGMLYPSAMVINGNAYVSGGGQECWSYDESSDSWTQVAFFGTRVAGSAFAINGNGYFGMGQQSYSNLPYLDLWQFTP